ncbi:itaconate CoA-transferase [Anaerolineae bacterium]|nr:itaconate CoA-transferase [Anaerolineae bacterium]
MSDFSHLTVLSIEQATTLPFLTLHLVQEGMRVIRVENPPRGDPNRWVGANVLGEEGMNAYFLPNNAGKEAITLNLASDDGKKILHTLIEKLPVDIFATNQRPKDYAKLGIDYETLRALDPKLIWVGITGFGPESNEAAYDPILQARAGFMDLTGERDGTPLVFGLPMVDLGAGEHAYGQVMRALYLRASTGQGSRIDISMFQSAVSWMVSPVMLTQSFGQMVERRGNTHQFFAPVSVYPTRDGFLYIAVGNDKQWEAIVATREFASLACDAYKRNAGRIAAVAALNRAISEITPGKTTDEWTAFFNALGVPASRVNSMREVVRDDLVQTRMLTAHDSHTGTTIHLPAPAVVPDFIEEKSFQMKFPPRLGEDNAKVYGALGYDVTDLSRRGII